MNRWILKGWIDELESGFKGLLSTIKNNLLLILLHFVTNVWSRLRAWIVFFSTSAWKLHLKTCRVKLHRCRNEQQSPIKNDFWGWWIWRFKVIVLTTYWQWFLHSFFQEKENLDFLALKLVINYNHRLCHKAWVNCGNAIYHIHLKAWVISGNANYDLYDRARWILSEFSGVNAQVKIWRLTLDWGTLIMKNLKMAFEASFR